MEQPLSMSKPNAPKRSLKLPIFLMAWPAALLLLSVVAYAVSNLAFAPSEPDTEFFGDQPVAASIVNILLFFAVGVAALLGPVSFIIGLVLLIGRSAKKA